MKLKLSIRNTIILFNALLICVTGGTIILVYSSRSEASIYALSNNLMREISKAAVNKTATYLEPAERALQDLDSISTTPDSRASVRTSPSRWIT